MKKQIHYMKIKTLLTATLILPAAAAMTSCDKVSEPDRFIPAEIIPERAILIEEFTGQLCTNCPDGHNAIRNILATLGDSVVPVSIHASNLAIDPPLGLKTATGEAYYKNYNSPALPTAVINMQTEPLQVDQWGSWINRLIVVPTPFTVVAESAVNADTGEMEINVAYSSAEEYKGKLMVWILENNIIRRQIDHGTNIPDYVHNHVFRAAVTPDIWGEEVDLKAHDPQYVSYKYPIDQFWKADDLYVVAFLYNGDGVAQVTASMKHE